MWHLFVVNQRRLNMYPTLTPPLPPPPTSNSPPPTLSATDRNTHTLVLSMAHSVYTDFEFFTWLQVLFFVCLSAFVVFLWGNNHLFVTMPGKRCWWGHKFQRGPPMRVKWAHSAESTDFLLLLRLPLLLPLGTLILWLINHMPCAPGNLCQRNEGKCSLSTEMKTMNCGTLLYTNR